MIFLLLCSDSYLAPIFYILSLFYYCTITSAEDKSSVDVDADYDRAEEAIFHGLEAVEAKVQKAVEEEVHSIFDADLDHDKRNKVADHAKNEKRQTHFLHKDHAKEEHKDHGFLHTIEEAEKATLHAIEEAEKATMHAIEEAEKATLEAFQADVERRYELAEHTNQALEEGAKKVKAAAHNYIEKRQTHFWPKEAIEQHEDHALFHAMEAAERAVLHGVQEEVDSIFHETHDTKKAQDKSTPTPQTNSPKWPKKREKAPTRLLQSYKEFAATC